MKHVAAALLLALGGREISKTLFFNFPRHKKLD